MINQKKATSIPIMVLVIGALVVFTFAIISFVTNLSSTRSTSLDLEPLKETYIDLAGFYFYSNLGQSNEEAVSKINSPESGKSVKLEKDYLTISRSKGSVSVLYRIHIKEVSSEDE